jgi:D-alanyl-D-alanine carboxypeptidase
MLARAFAAAFALTPALFFACTSTHPTGQPPASDGGTDAGSDADLDLDAGDGGADAGDDAASPACVTLASKLQSALQKVAAKDKAAGAVLGVSTPACGRWVGAAGASTATTPLDPADVLRIGSVTKTFVATTVLQLADQGKLALTDPLETWVPGFPGGAGITVRELLNHTSGIFDYLDDTTFAATEMANPGTVWTPEQLATIAGSNTPYFAPGQGWHYSNSDYVLLGMVIEKATGQKAGAVLHAQAIDVAHLAFTVLDGYEPIKGTLAHGYAAGNADVSTSYDPSWAWTAGGMVASAGDLVDWAGALYGGSVLSASALSEMVTPVDTGMSGVGYGLGVFVYDPSIVGGTPGWGHAGDIPGYHTQVLYLPEKKIAIVSMVNSDGEDPNDVTVAALDILLP